MTTSPPYSTIRLAFSMTICDTCTCREDGSSNVELMTSQLLPFTSPLHVGHFLRPLVDQQHDHVGVGEVLQDGVGHLLQQDRLAGSRRADDQAPLPEADRRDHVDDPQWRGPSGSYSITMRLIRVQRREVVEAGPCRSACSGPGS